MEGRSGAFCRMVATPSEVESIRESASLAERASWDVGSEVGRVAWSGSSSERKGKSWRTMEEVVMYLERWATSEDWVADWMPRPP